jgi:hypothetical protein
MDDNFIRANRALFEGDRGKIAEFLQDVPLSGRKLWLLAAASDDEAERTSLLQGVVAEGEAPYADMARDILEREHYFAQEIAKPPRWQERIMRNRQRIIQVALAVVAIIVIVLVGRNFIFPSDSGSAGTVGNTTPIAGSTDTPTPTSTATVTAIPANPINGVSYMPLGSLRIINAEFPTSRAIGAGSTLVTPPPGSAFIAIQYEFTCGTVAAFCSNPPQGQLGLQLADTSLGIIPDSGLTLAGESRPGQISSGGTIQSWIVFPVPTNQAPRKLAIGISTQNDNQIDKTLFIELPTSP